MRDWPNELCSFFVGEGRYSCPMTNRLKVRELLCVVRETVTCISNMDACCVYWKNWKEELRRQVRFWLSEVGFRRGRNWESRSRRL